jgi:hypothetical protein
MDFRIDRRAFVVTTDRGVSQPVRDRKYWMSRPASERLAAVD